MDQLRYRFKTILRTRGFLLRCVIFPIIIATLCYTSLERAQYSTISEEDRISIGIVDVNDFVGDIFDESRFDVYSITETVAEKYLEDGVISSYILMADTPELITIKYEDEQKITKAYLDAYLAGAPVARLKEQHIVQDLERVEPSALTSHFAKFSMAATCTCLSGVLLLILIGKNHREIVIRTSLAARSGMYIIIQDVIVVVTLLAAIFFILYGYIYFVLRA